MVLGLFLLKRKSGETSFFFSRQVVCKLRSPKGAAALKITEDGKNWFGKISLCLRPEASPEMLPLEEKFAL